LCNNDCIVLIERWTWILLMIQASKSLAEFINTFSDSFLLIKFLCFILQQLCMNLLICNNYYSLTVAILLFMLLFCYSLGILLSKFSFFLINPYSFPFIFITIRFLYFYPSSISFTITFLLNITFSSSKLP